MGLEIGSWWTVYLFQFILNYLTNAEYIICSRPAGSKSTLCSPVISSAYKVNLDSRMLDKILYVVDKSGIPA